MIGIVPSYHFFPIIARESLLSSIIKTWANISLYKYIPQVYSNMRKMTQIGSFILLVFIQYLDGRKSKTILMSINTCLVQ